MAVLHIKAQKTFSKGEGDEPAGEWITVENVEVPYTIEGLDPETEYEVQVQGIYEDAKGTTDWTSSVFFTTLPEENPGITELYVVGTFNDWNQLEDGGRIQLQENEEGCYVGNITLEAGAEFKLITPAETEGEWIWFGGVDDNQVGYFEINQDLLGQNISLVDGANFRMVDGGDYVITVMEAPRGLNEPLVMTVEKVTGINTITADQNSNVWYNLQGVKFNGMPSVPGIYINNGKKVVVK